MLSTLLDNLLRGRRAKRALAQAEAAFDAGDTAQAIALIEPAYRAAPHDARLMSALGQALIACDQFEQGFALVENAVRAAPELTPARVAIARELQYAGRIGLALEHLRAAAALEPDAPHVARALVRPLLETCDWTQATRVREDLLERIRGGRPWTDRITPMDALLLGLPRAARARSAAARAAEIERYERDGASLGRRPIARDGRIRIAYLSGDFRDHPVTHLAWRLFERHDRSAFEVHAFSFGRDDGSVHRRRVMEGADRFVDVRGHSNAAIARTIHAAEIDVLVDLGGHAPGARIGILAHRPAPLQAHYLGYPATTGARFVDYFLADAVVAPAALEAEFTERLVRLADTFMISDETIAAAPPVQRAQHGLTDDRFIFVNFNQNSRIDEEVWAAWMEILAAVPRSVLWLKFANDIACANLRSAAVARGVDGGRIVFARDLPDKAAHISRLRLADLGLDTFGRYNGHTSTADALWAGVPVVTTPSDCFPGRVAASLLAASGMSECVVPDVAAYKAFAIGYALDAQRRNAARAALQSAQGGAAFFRPERIVRSLERAYLAMVERARKGEAPATIDLPT